MNKSFLLSLLSCSLIFPGCSFAEKQDEPVETNSSYRETLSGNYLAGRFAQRRQDWASANKFLNRILENNPENSDLEKSNMLFSVGAGHIEQGVALAQKVVQEDPENLLALLILSAEKIRQEDYAGAISFLNKIEEDSIAAFVKPPIMAWVNFADQKPVSHDTLLKNPAHAYHGILLSAFGNDISALDDLLPVAVQQPSLKSESLESMARLYTALEKEKKNTETFDQEFKNLLSLHDIQSIPDGIALAFHDVAKALLMEGSDTSALLIARLAGHVKKNPFDDNALLITRIFSFSERFEDAILQAKTIPLNSEHYKTAQLYIATLYEENGVPEKAIETLEDLYDEQENPDYLMLIGDIYRKQDDFKNALKFYNRAARQIGEPIPSHYWSLLYFRGIAYERLGDWARAEKDLSKALEYQPEDPYILNYLGYSWVDKGDNLEKALEFIKKAVSLRPQDGYIVDSLGWVYYRLQQYEEAVKHLEKAVSLKPYDPVINDHLGDAYWKTGRVLEARFQWRRALNHLEENKEADLDPEAVEKKIRFGLTGKNDQEASNKKEQQDNLHALNR